MCQNDVSVDRSTLDRQGCVEVERRCQQLNGKSKSARSSWYWQSNSESVWTGWRFFYALPHLITTQSCGIRPGPVFTASYWRFHLSAFPLKSITFLNHQLLNIYSVCLLQPVLHQAATLMNYFLCLKLFVVSNSFYWSSSLLPWNPVNLFWLEF